MDYESPGFAAPINVRAGCGAGAFFEVLVVTIFVTVDGEAETYKIEL